MIIHDSMIYHLSSIPYIIECKLNRSKYLEIRHLYNLELIPEISLMTHSRACSLADHDAAILVDGTHTGGKSPRPEPTRHCHGAFPTFRLQVVLKHGFARLHMLHDSNMLKNRVRTQTFCFNPRIKNCFLTAPLLSQNLRRLRGESPAYQVRYPNNAVFPGWLLRMDDDRSSLLKHLPASEGRTTPSLHH